MCWKMKEINGTRVVKEDGAFVLAPPFILHSYSNIDIASTFYTERRRLRVEGGNHYWSVGGWGLETILMTTQNRGIYSLFLFPWS
jgi:hypothetical protein